MTDKLVKLKDAIDAIKDAMICNAKGSAKFVNTGLTAAIITIQSLPSVDIGEDRWVPVSERLPGEDGDTLVFDQDGDMAIFRFETEEKYWDTSWYITHWQPLPQPPKQ